jgi:hypothetical protein
MSAKPRKKPEPIAQSEDTGVADVRAVREKISARYKGDLRRHAADTNRIVAPLIKKLGLREGTPAGRRHRRSGTEG